MDIKECEMQEKRADKYRTLQKDLEWWQGLLEHIECASESICINTITKDRIQQSALADNPDRLNFLKEILKNGVSEKITTIKKNISDI